MTSALLPPATIGIIGGGQLGMMTAREAHRMGFRTAIWDPDPDCPSSKLADLLISAPFSDSTAARRLAESTDVVTYEFENIDPSMVEKIERSRNVFPGSGILKVAQNRILEKDTLRRSGFPVVPFALARNEKELREAVRTLGFPVVVKTTTAGYDGKGQVVITRDDELNDLCKIRGDKFPECVAEKFLPLQVELSVVAIRSRDGAVHTFPVVANEHRENILHVTRVPARISETIHNEAVRLATAIIDHFSIVGILCVEMFVTREEKVIVNELAPRPHNSGHFSLDACSFSQFEALVRVVCGLPVQAPRLLSDCGMVNLLGKHLERINLIKAQEIPGTKVHLYGKKRLEPKRKMGHITIVGNSSDEVEKRISLIERLIGETVNEESERQIVETSFEGKEN